MINLHVISGICGFIGLSLSAAGIKHLLVSNDIWSIIFPLLTFSSLIMGIALYTIKGIGGFRTSQRRFHLLRGILGFAGISLGIYGLKFLNLGLFQILVNLYPVLTLVLAVLVLKEFIGIRAWVAVGLSLAGVVFAFDPKLEGGVMVLFPLGVAVSLAGQSIIVRLRTRDTSLVWAFYTELTAAFLALLAFLAWGNGRLPFDEPFLFFGVALVDGISIFLITHAFHGDRAGRIAPLAYLSIPSAALFGLLFFGEPIHWEMLLAAALIIVGGVFALREADRVSEDTAQSRGWSKALTRET